MRNEWIDQQNDRVECDSYANRNGSGKWRGTFVAVNLIIGSISNTDG